MRYSEIAKSTQASFSERIINIAVLGDSGVGKTDLCLGALRKNYRLPFKPKPTIGIELYTTQRTINNQFIKVGVWDYNGQIKYQGDEDENLRYMDAFILVFDISNLASFESLGEWVKLAKSDEMNAMYVVVATKSDLKRKVPEEQVAEFVKGLDAVYMEVSVEQNIAVREPFERIIAGLCIWELDGQMNIQAEGEEKGMCCNTCKGYECNIF